MGTDKNFHNRHVLSQLLELESRKGIGIMITTLFNECCMTSSMTTDDFFVSIHCLAEAGLIAIENHFTIYSNIEGL
jgi:hypothetical protein